ncbi:MAG: hypothetical protein J7J76_06850 [Candidatus Latescibacteria bacterium]|nr:hypothetical protein [Candidatus Latescibacterota bacterium]
MERLKVRLKLMLLLIVSVAAFSVGCWNPFAPPEHKRRPDTQLTVQPRTTPENVINNLIYAMTNRDIEVYEDCLDEDYWYHSPPVFPDDPESFLDLSKDDDVTIVRRIFGLDPTYDRPGFQVIEFTFYHGKPQIELGEDKPEEHPDENWVVFEGTVDMYLYSDETKEHGHHVNQTMIYKLREDSEGMWTIIRWEDVIPQ